MGATDRLIQLLAPLGVYSFEGGTYSLGQLKALGSQIDEAESQMREHEKNSSIMTATDEALQQYGQLFGYGLTGRQGDDLRLPIIALLNIGGDGFTLAAVNEAIAQCGINALVSELGDGVLAVSFPGQMGVPKGFEFIKTVVEDILPAHLETQYIFAYLTWKDATALTWADVAGYTWEELRMLDIR